MVCPRDDVQKAAASASAAPEPRLDLALETLRADGLVAVPTETVWGLCASARSGGSLEALHRFKGRSEEKATSVFVASWQSLAALGVAPGPLARALIDRFWPGPLTLVMHSEESFARGVARSDGSLGVRCSPHPTVASLTRAVERAGLGPLTATSLNRSGQPPARTLAEARDVCEAGVAAAPVFVLYDGEDATGAAPSTVLDVTGNTPRVLRLGAIGQADLELVFAQQRSRGPVDSR